MGSPKDEIPSIVREMHYTEFRRTATSLMCIEVLMCTLVEEAHDSAPHATVKYS